MTFSLRTEQGRVLVCVPNGLLAQTFGATGAADEIFATFAQHIDLLNAAALARLNDSATFPAEIILDEGDIAQAQKQSWNVAGRDLQ